MGHDMRKSIWLIGATSAVMMIAPSAAPAVGAAEAPPLACVSGHLDRCFGSLEEAVKRTVNGDVVRLAAGTYDGPVTITKSIRVVGAGEGRTIIDGGGPVLTVQATSTYRPVVELIDLTITGGVNTGTALNGKVRATTPSAAASSSLTQTATVAPAPLSPSGG